MVIKRLNKTIKDVIIQGANKTEYAKKKKIENHGPHRVYSKDYMNARSFYEHTNMDTRYREGRILTQNPGLLALVVKGLQL